MAAAALIMPTTTLAAVAATSGPASASVLSCTVTASVNFAAPGLSKVGTGSSTAKTTSTTVNGSSLTCNTGSGTLGTLTIVSKSNKCVGNGVGKSPTTEPTCTGKKTPPYVYGSLYDFANSGSAIQKALKKLSFTVAGTGYLVKASSANEVIGGACGAGVVGFSISGAVKAPKAIKGDAANMVACLSNDSGPGTTGNFGADLATPGVTITGATIGGNSALSLG